MSQENIEVVRRHIEAYDRDDAAGALASLDDHVILDTTRVSFGGLTGAVSHGHDGVVQEMRSWLGAFEDYAFEIEQLTDLGGGTVAVVIAERGRGKGSGVLVERTMAGLYTVLDGKIARVTFFPTEQDALEAAGLSE
jgi:ketosteroid isomerase-like protein